MILIFKKIHAPNISSRKSFWNVMVFPFLELFGENHKFETYFGKFEGILFDFFNVINWVGII